MQIRTLIGGLLLLGLFSCGEDNPTDRYQYTLPQWQKLTIDVPGPSTGEDADNNPFVHYRLEVDFTHSDTSFRVPGFYAADGNAATSRADTGHIWQVRFRPPIRGDWEYSAQLYAGDSIVFASTAELASAEVITSLAGRILVEDPRAGESGRLVRAHPRYLEWAESGEVFVKGGADSPENFLAYADFDGTYRHSNNFRDGESKTEGLHQYEPHRDDWKTDDPSWGDGKGKGIIGALNYLAGKDINSVYFLTMNINGDGKDVFPYASHEDFFRFDCSKLDQWEIVFDHMDDELGMMLHAVTQETENENLLDGGDTGPARSLYYRELVARFGHHRAVNWNLGEENGPNSWSEGGQTTEQRAAMAAWFAANDPYRNHVSVHTHPDPGELAHQFDPLLGNSNLGGISLQIGNPYQAHEVVKEWTQKSLDAGAPWLVMLDEIGPWYRGLDADTVGPYNNQDSVRSLVLWGSLMAGAGGAEWYFGAYQPQNDLGVENYRTYDRAWGWTANARHFFQRYADPRSMNPADELVQGGHFCLADPAGDYVVFLPFGGPATLDLSEREGSFTVSWYDPLAGGELQSGSVSTVSGGSTVDLGAPPTRLDKDWAILIAAEKGS